MRTGRLRARERLDAAAARVIRPRSALWPPLRRSDRLAPVTSQGDDSADVRARSRVRAGAVLTVAAILGSAGAANAVPPQELVRSADGPQRLARFW